VFLSVEVEVMEIFEGGLSISAFWMN